MKLKLAIAALCITLSTTTSASIMETKDLNGSERPGIVLVDILNNMLAQSRPFKGESSKR